MSDAVFIGIDVSRDTLEIGSTKQASTSQKTNDTAGIEALSAELVALAPALVVLEATGGYEFEAACALQAAGLAVAVVNPRQARDFARAMGALAKTDSLDARMLAEFARVLHQHPERERFIKPLADAELQRLQALVLRRRQLVGMPTSERQRLRMSHASARPSIERVIEFLKTQIEDIERDCAAHVSTHHAELAQALGSVKGIGPATIATLLGAFCTLPQCRQSRKPGRPDSLSATLKDSPGLLSSPKLTSRKVTREMNSKPKGSSPAYLQPAQGCDEQVRRRHPGTLQEAVHQLPDNRRNQAASRGIAGGRRSG